MKILIINKYGPKHPKKGGAEIRLKEIFQRLAKKHDIYLLTSMFPGAKRKEKYKGINIIRLGKMNSDNTIRIHFLIILKLKKFLNKIKPDILYEDISVIPFFTPIFYPKQKKVIIIHNFNRSHFFKSQRFIFAIIGYLAEKMFSWFYKKENLIVVSEWMKKELKKLHFKNITKVLNGVDHSLISNKKYSKNPTILFLGRLEGRKGIDYFLKTYPIVKKYISNIKYIIAGGEFLFVNNNISLKEFKKANKNKNIEFLGYVSENKKKELFQKCWLYSVPSRIEGYGISVLEANCTGTFVVGNNVKGLQESIKNKKTGRLVNCSNPKIFAKALIKELNIKRLTKKENDCRKWAKFHNWDKAAQETNNFFNKIVLKENKEIK